MIRYAKVAREEKIDIFAIGIGQKARRNQLNQITGDATRVYSQKTFQGLLGFIKTLKIVQFDCFAPNEYVDYCNRGMFQNLPRHTISNINSDSRRSGCSQICLNDPRRAVCACYFNYALGEDEKSCVPTIVQATQRPISIGIQESTIINDKPNHLSTNSTEQPLTGVAHWVDENKAILKTVLIIVISCCCAMFVLFAIIIIIKRRKNRGSDSGRYFER